MPRCKPGVEDCAAWPSRVRAPACASHETGQVPDCGACPGDGTICPSTCRLAEESPPLPVTPRGSMGEEVVGGLVGPLSAADAVDVAMRQARQDATIGALTDADRYAFVRKLSPAAFAELWAEGITTGRAFDDLVDAGIAAERATRA